MEIKYSPRLFTKIFISILLISGQVCSKSTFSFTSTVHTKKILLYLYCTHRNEWVKNTIHHGVFIFNHESSTRSTVDRLKALKIIESSFFSSFNAIYVHDYVIRCKDISTGDPVELLRRWVRILPLLGFHEPFSGQGKDDKESWSTTSTSPSVNNHN